MVHFIGAGPGAPDLITVRGQKLLGEADIIIYAGSLVNPALLDLKKEGCVVYNSATMTLEQVIDVMKEAESKGQTVARLHTGDPCLYGAIREQIDALDALGIAGQLYISFLGGSPAALITALALHLAQLVNGVYALDLYAEDLFYGLADLNLVGSLGYFKGVNTVGDVIIALLGEDRSLDDVVCSLHQTYTSSIFATESLVRISFLYFRIS